MQAEHLIALLTTSGWDGRLRAISSGAPWVPLVYSAARHAVEEVPLSQPVRRRRVGACKRLGSAEKPNEYTEKPAGTWTLLALVDNGDSTDRKP